MSQRDLFSSLSSVLTDQETESSLRTSENGNSYYNHHPKISYNSSTSSKSDKDKKTLQN